jgi:hypothetical protein
MADTGYGVVVRDGGQCLFASPVLDTRAEAEAFQQRMGAQAEVVDVETLRRLKSSMVNGEFYKRSLRGRDRLWTSNVLLRDLETGNQIGECWLEEARAPDEAEAARRIRNKAWDSVDTRLNDVSIELVDGPTCRTVGD